MAERIEVFEVTVPAGTAISAPQNTSLSFLDGHVTKIEVRIPPGPSGLVGFRFVHSQQVIIPFSGTTWIVADDEKLEWPVEGYPTNDDWSVRAYNTDIYPHTLYIRFLVTERVIPLSPYPATLMIES